MLNSPIVAVSLLWTAGYIAGCLFPVSWMTLYASLLCGVLATIIWSLKVRGRHWLCGILLLCAGAGYFQETEQSNRTHVPKEWENREIRLTGTISSIVEVDGDRASFLVKGRAAPAGEAEFAKQSELFKVNVKLLRQDEQSITKGWERGDRIELGGTLRAPQEARNFGGFDYRRYLHYRYIHWLVQVKGSGQAEVSTPEKPGFTDMLRWNDRFRHFLGSTVENVFPPHQAGFMKSMLIGMTDDMDPEQFRQFSRLGLTHILAISGLNVAIFLACLMWTLRRLGMTREACLMACMALLPLYILVTGASPSIVRAGLMGLVALYAAYRRVLKDGLHSVMLVGLLMLLWEPYYLFDVSFQLSFLVTIGLIVGVPAMNRLLPVRFAPLRNAVSITVVSQLISFPLSIYYFNQLSLLSLLANLLLVPLFSMAVMPAGTAAMVLGTFWTTGGQWLGRLVSALNEGIFFLVDHASHWDSFQTLWPTPTFYWMILYYISLAFLGHALYQAKPKTLTDGPPLLSPQGKAHVWIAPGLALAAFSALLWNGYHPERWSEDGRVQFIDVGQGDSILIRTPVKRSFILVDGGGTVTFRKPGEEWKNRQDPYEVGRKLLVPLLKQRGVHRIDYLIVSHEDADHCGGLQAVLEEIPVTALLFNGTLKPAPAVEKLFRTALEKKVKLVAVHEGQTLKVDSKTAIQFLYPLSRGEREQAVRVEKDQNSESVVFRMDMDGTRWLFTGDMDKAAEYEVLRQLSTADDHLPAIDVLKVAHHGSKTSTSDEWLRAWKPRTAVISVGGHNIYGHPHPQVTERLALAGVHLFRTDLHGEIQMQVRDGIIMYRTKLSEQAADEQ